MIELLGALATILAVTGVVLNNYKIPACFYLWIISNTLSLYIHYQTNIWTLQLRDAVFIILAIHGIHQWKTKPKQENIK